MSYGEFCVYQFFSDDLYDQVIEFVDAETAVKTAYRLTQSVGARFGIVQRVIITDGGDHTCFEWKNSEGVTFPTPEMRKATV